MVLILKVLIYGVIIIRQKCIPIKFGKRFYLIIDVTTTDSPNNFINLILSIILFKFINGINIHEAKTLEAKISIKDIHKLYYSSTSLFVSFKSNILIIQTFN